MCSSLNIMDTVVQIARSTLDSQPHLDAAAVAGAHAAASLPATAAGAATQQQQQQQAGQAPRLPSSASLRRQYDNVDQVLQGGKRLAGEGERGGGGGANGSARLSRVAAALAQSPRFLILDLRQAQAPRPPPSRIASC